MARCRTCFRPDRGVHPDNVFYVAPRDGEKKVKQGGSATVLFE
jgi:hypothetical protein